MQDEILKDYTRVSTILSRWNDFSKIDAKVLATKQDIGTEVHLAIDTYLDGGFAPLSIRGNGYFDSYLKWWETFDRHAILCKEQRLYCHKLKITGACDLIVKAGEGGLLVDYKTSAKESPLSWPLQATFYRYLAEVNGYKMADRALFIQLDPDGKKPKIHEYKLTPQLHRVAISCLDCHRYFSQT